MQNRVIFQLSRTYQRVPIINQSLTHQQPALAGGACAMASFTRLVCQAGADHRSGSELISSSAKWRADGLQQPTIVGNIIPGSKESSIDSHEAFIYH